MTAKKTVPNDNATQDDAEEPEDRGATGGSETVEAEVHKADETENYPLEEENVENVAGNEEVEAEDEDEEDEEDEEEDVDQDDPEFQRIMAAAEVRLKRVELFTFCCQTGRVDLKRVINLYCFSFRTWGQWCLPWPAQGQGGSWRR